jgi:hypothetical protein
MRTSTLGVDNSLLQFGYEVSGVLLKENAAKK